MVQVAQCQGHLEVAMWHINAQYILPHHVNTIVFI